MTLGVAKVRIFLTDSTWCSFASLTNDNIWFVYIKRDSVFKKNLLNVKGNFTLCQINSTNQIVVVFLLFFLKIEFTRIARSGRL